MQESGNELFQRLRAAESQRRAAALEQAMAQAHERGKEPFDYKRLRALAQLRTCDDAQTLEYEYYVVWRRLESLEAFARQLEINEQYDGGDLGT